MRQQEQERRLTAISSTTLSRMNQRSLEGLPAGNQCSVSMPARGGAGRGQRAGRPA